MTSPLPQQLTELGVTSQLFIDATASATADARMCTEYDAPAMPGITFWSRVNRYMAEALTDPRQTSQPWKWTNRDSILRVVHPSGSHAITAISGQGGAGNMKKRPRSKNPKGRVMAGLVEKNGQFAIMSRDHVEFKAQLDDMPLWFLLYERDNNGFLKAELSLPVKMHGKYVDDWQVRFPIDLPDTDPGASIDLDAPSNDGGPDVLVEFLQA